MLLLTLGCLFAIGLIADLTGRFTFLPRVSVLILAGVLVGPAVFALVPAQYVASWFPTLTAFALAMIGFLLGQQLTLPKLRSHGGPSMLIALLKVIGSALVVCIALLAIGVELVPAILLAGISSATAPAATYDVVRESGSQGPFTELLLRVVAIDDAWGLILFALLVSLAKTVTGASIGVFLAGALWEVVGSLLLGTVLGIPMAYLTGRLEVGSNTGEPIQAEALGFVLICAGLAIVLELSPILSAMAMGSVVATLAKHHTRSFHAIEGIEWPFMILFFILAGASLEFRGVALFGSIAVAYIVARTVGAYFGVYGAASWLNLDKNTKHWLGIALLPQAGVALGMALIAAQTFPEYGNLILTCILVATIFLELIAPIATRLILKQVGETGKVSDEPLR